MDTFVSEEDVAAFREYMSDPSARAAFVEYKAEAASNGTARRYEHVLRAVSSRPWAVHEPMLAIIVDVLTFRAFGGRLTAEEIEGRIGAARRSTSTEAPRGVARIPVSGVIIPKAGAMDQMSGGTSAEALSRSIRSAAGNPDVSSIVLDIDSPGGAVDGIPELAAVIAQVNEQKPVVAVANTEALSAAYWLASQAGRIVASPSARVGSIGVISAHEDRSGQAEQKGISTTLVTAGKFKAEINPFEPLSDSGRAHLQATVDEFYGMFVKAVAEGRGATEAAVRSGFGEGRVVTATDAMKFGMIDEIATIDQVISQELATGGRAVAARHRAPAVVAVGLDAPEDLEGGAETPALVAVSAGNADNPLDLDAIRQRMGGVEEPEAPVVDEATREAEEEVTRVAADGETTRDVEMAKLLEAIQVPPDPPVDQLSVQAAVDNSSWDGNRAMGECSSASDYRSICAGEHSVGTPDQRQHWALPHHYLGKGPNADGVRSALSRLPQTQNLSNRGAAQRHLDAHMGEISPGGSNAQAEGPPDTPDSTSDDPEIQSLKAELELLSLPE